MRTEAEAVIGVVEAFWSALAGGDDAALAPLVAPDALEISVGTAPGFAARFRVTLGLTSVDCARMDVVPSMLSELPREGLPGRAFLVGSMRRGLIADMEAGPALVAALIVVDLDGEWRVWGQNRNFPGLTLLGGQGPNQPPGGARA